MIWDRLVSTPFVQAVSDVGSLSVLCGTGVGVWLSRPLSTGMFGLVIGRAGMRFCRFRRRSEQGEGLFIPERFEGVVGQETASRGRVFILYSGSMGINTAGC